MDKIDVIVTWVDGQDEDWLKERSETTGSVTMKDNQYRDWGLLKYWFRGIEQYAPWVNRVHFVTWGHIPNFLNVEHPLLNIVKHQEYIPEEYLPTFNSNPIELNFHRIEGLEEKFVLFNDDMYLTNTTTKEDFFEKGMPRDVAILNPIVPARFDTISGIMLNNMGIINEHHSLRRSIKSDPFKWFNLKYKHLNLLNLMFLPWKNTVGLYQQHLPSSMLKSTFNTIWDKEFDILDSVSRNNVRSNKLDVNQWLMKEWQVMEGNFQPRSISFGKYIQVSKETDIKNVEKALMSNRTKTICVNDHVVENVEEVMTSLVSIFEKKFPTKSTFEI